MACTTLFLFAAFACLIAACLVVDKAEKGHRRRCARAVHVEPAHPPR